jgi:hypothetical protein
MVYFVNISAVPPSPTMNPSPAPTLAPTAKTTASPTAPIANPTKAPFSPASSQSTDLSPNDKNVIFLDRQKVACAESTPLQRFGLGNLFFFIAFSAFYFISLLFFQTNNFIDKHSTQRRLRLVW